MISKKILNVDRAHRGEISFLDCAWHDCERKAVQLHRIRLHDHARGLRCDHPDAKHPWMAFCSEKHRQLHIHSHIAHGKLPTGEHGRLT